MRPKYSFVNELVINKMLMCRMKSIYGSQISRQFNECEYDEGDGRPWKLNPTHQFKMTVIHIRGCSPKLVKSAGRQAAQY